MRKGLQTQKGRSKAIQAQLQGRKVSEGKILFMIYERFCHKDKNISTVNNLFKFVLYKK